MSVIEIRHLTNFQHALKRVVCNVALTRPTNKPNHFEVIVFRHCYSANAAQTAEIRVKFNFFDKMIYDSYIPLVVSTCLG